MESVSERSRPFREEPLARRVKMKRSAPRSNKFNGRPCCSSCQEKHQASRSWSQLTNRAQEQVAKLVQVLRLPRHSQSAAAQLPKLECSPQRHFGSSVWRANQDETHGHRDIHHQVHAHASSETSLPPPPPPAEITELRFVTTCHTTKTLTETATPPPSPPRPLKTTCQASTTSPRLPAPTSADANNLRADRRHFWPRWPHGSSGGENGTRKPSPCTNHYQPWALRALTLSSISLLVALIASNSLTSTSGGGVASAYQLTNNLIANNLPPKFVHALTASATGPGGGASAAATMSPPQSQTSSEIVVRVKEGQASVGKLIYTLKGEDPDDDPLTFGVLGSMASELLRIENVPGNQANVYLRKELDRETTESHQVVITLTDGKLGRGNWITKSMLIIVEDVNDNYPVFGPHRTAISIREDTRAPLVIETIEATDADEGRFGQVIYKLDETTLANGDQLGASGSGHESTGGGGGQRTQLISDMFAIETVDGRGVISLIGQLDYEQRPLYQLRILAVDRAHENERLSTSTSILVSVEDCEDQAPMFTFAPSITRIPENSPVGSAVVRVSAIDGDRGVNAPIKYSIVSVNGQEVGFERNLFSIGSDSGQLTVAHELDRELNSGGGGGTATRAGAAASGNQQPGSYVIQVRATELGAQVSGADSLSASVSTELTVILTDVNDELPTFDQAEYYGELLENSPAESLVTFVRAPPAAATLATTSQPPQQQQQQLIVGAKVTDRDQGTNGTFTLHLEGEHGHLFDVWPGEATNEANLMIKVSSAASAAGSSKYFDYERTKELRITLVAREKYPSHSGGQVAPSGEERFSTAEMVIRLRDANDNYPQFDSELYKVEIPENAIRGMHICAVKALDADSGALGTAGLRYTEIRGERANKFKLDPLTGVITLKTNEHGFDRESVAQHHLIVEARDNLGTGNRNTTQLLIILTDVNDQRPKFALDQYETFIYENELDFQSPLQVQAHDADAAGTQNSKITYSIVAGDPQQNFTIDPLTGRIRVRTSLLAAPPGHHAQLDGPTGTHPPEGMPRSQQDPGEQLPSGNQGAQQPAGESNFVQATGLDFERIAQKRDDTRQFNLTIRAQDSGSPEPLASTTQVIVLVYDKNDHAPVFSRALYAKSLREDAPGGSPVIQVQALDGDHSPTNSKISYRIASGGSDKFVIDSDSGLISIANGANLDIDRVQGGGQRRTSYLLNVLAFDGSFGPNQKSSSCLVNISIIDVNNKAPEFVSLGASQQGLLAATAASQSPTPGLAARQQQQQQQQVATNQQSVFVNEDAPYGLIVTRVFAADLDSSAELRYSINYARSEARNEDMLLVEPALYRDVFSIEPMDGTIKVNKQLDRELFDQVKLRLQVEDLAAQTSDQVAHTYLLIRITDINDNRPSFKKAVYKAVVNENSISGTSVITMAADDRDLNKTLRYSLEAATPEVARLVRINPRSGEVTVNDKIDRELHPLINVTIKAEDYGQPRSLTGSAQLIITVRDENDNNPIFLNATHLRPGAGSSIANSLLARGLNDSSAQTPPANHNNHDQHLPTPATSEAREAALRASSYRLRSLGPQLASGRGLSGLDDQLPVLELTEDQLLAGEAHQNQHQQAGGASFSSFAHAPREQPHDENGQELALLAPGSSAYVREDAPVGHQMAYVRAEDADLGNNGRVTYLLDPNSSGGGKFRIDRDTGILSVAQQLDREQQKHYTLIIEACDNFDLGYATGESRRAFTQVAIQVLDVNDNAPLISTNPLHTAASSRDHHSPGLAPPQAQGLASSSSSSPSGERPSYDEAMNSPGPYEMALSECLFINEFQALNEPILTVSASDPDDPELPNGQIDLAIMNQAQNEIFSLVPIRNASPSKRGISMASSPSGGALTTTSSPATTSGPDHLGDDDDPDQSRPVDAHADRTGQRRRRKRSFGSTPLVGQLVSQPGTFYRRPPGGSMTSVGDRFGAPVTTTSMPALSSQQQQQQQQQQLHLRQLQQVQRIAGGEQQMHVVVSQSLRERVGNYSLLVRATDRGTPALSSLKLINICVLDVNNHAPVFTRPSLNHTIRIMENATLGSYVTQVEASDRDHGLNGELAYSLKATNIQSSNSDWQAFRIDRLSGVITTAKLFNRQLKKYYTLRVQAQDLGRPTSLSSDIDINIMIVNSGKYQPEFEVQTQALVFTENVAPGLEWFKLLQTTNLDDDPALINANNNNSGGGGESGNTGSASNWLSSPCYYIVDGDDSEQVFHLDRYTHKLSNQRELDREKKLNYTLIVKASNNCSRPPAGAALSSRLLAPPPPPTAPSQVSAGATGGSQEVSLTTPTTTTSTTGGPLFGAAELASLAGSGTAAGRRAKRATQVAVTDAGGPAGARASASSKRMAKRVDYQPASTGLVLGAAGRVSDDATPFLPVDQAGPGPHQSALSSAELSATKEAALASALDALVASDKSLLKVSIRIKDVNDNAPKFTQKIYTGGITTEADFGTVFMIVQANDADADLNGQVTYSIVKPIKRNLSLQQHASAVPPPAQLPAAIPASTRQKRQAAESIESPLGAANLRHELATSVSEHQIERSTGNELQQVSPPLGLDSDDLFVINAQTGEISLNFDPQKHMKGYFEFEIQAKDPDGLGDTARVLIYLLRQDQRVKFVLRLTPQELRQRLNKFRSVFGNITGAIVNIDSYKYYENQDGTVDKKKTSLYLHFVQPEDNTIIDVDKVLTLIDNNIEYLDELYKEFHVLSSEAAHLPLGSLGSGALVDPIDQVRTGLLGISSFLALILVLVIALCLNQRTRYERQLKAATVTAFGSSPLHLDPDFHTQTNLPNTNLHSQDPNPIWMVNNHPHHHHYGGGGGGGSSQDDALWPPASGQGDDAKGGGERRQAAPTGGVAGKPRLHRPASRTRAELYLDESELEAAERAHQQSAAAAANKQHQKLFHSASSGVGMALDDELDELDDDSKGDVDELSTSGGDLNSSDLNSLSGQHHHHHHESTHQAHHHYNATSAATATPRDSLASSHGQVSSPSSSGSNSASTTNERQVLCTSSGEPKLHKPAPTAKQQQQQQQHKQTTIAKGNPSANQVGARQQHFQKASGHMTPGANSTFGAGAFKEVTIYTEQPRQQQQQQKRQQARANCQQQPAQVAPQHQQQTSQVNRLTSQFDAAKLQPIIQQQNQPIYVSAQQKQQRPILANQKPQQLKSHILIHSNGADANQGIIKATSTSNSSTTKQMIHHLDAKFVPPAQQANNKLANLTMQQQHLEQSVNNFETSLSKLSILNLETTEL